MTELSAHVAHARDEMTRVHEGLLARMAETTESIGACLARVAQIDAELQALIRAADEESAAFIDAVQERRSACGDADGGSRVPAVRLTQRQDLAELDRETSTRFQHEMARLDKEEATARKKLLVSLY